MNRTESFIDNNQDFFKRPQVGQDASMPLVITRNLTKSFFKGKQEIQVLKNINMHILSGECVAVTGVSGAGKSTLLHILGTLEPPTSGEVLFGTQKRDLFKLNSRELAWFRNRMLGFVFQFHYLLPEFNAVENVMMPALIAGASKKNSERQAKELLELVGLKHRFNHRPAELSGGEQQRVAIARSVILRPKLLFADELTGNLDSENSEMVMEVLVELNKKIGISILLVTHNNDLTKRMHRVINMRDGMFVSN